MIEYDFYGPPGSGKTTRMIEIARSAINCYGPDQVAFCTFTRTAADEARERAAATLGIQGSASTIRQRLPWFGTIHSLAFRLCGMTQRQMLSAAKLREFCDEYHLDPPGSTITWIEGYFELSNRPAPIDLVQALLSVAAHRKISWNAALEFLPAEDVAAAGAGFLVGLAAQFVAWKREQELYDFDDLLHLGLEQRLPVKVLICDEVQDNSALLWHVLDTWAQSVERLVAAGDFYQAIYAFMGADPDLFLRRTGTRRVIGNSHRFGPRTTAFCRDLLVDAFGREAEQVLSTWQGIGGQPRDGTHLYLARTARLLRHFTDDLESCGEPYARYRGKAPLQTASATAYETLRQLQAGLSVDGAHLTQVVKQLPKGFLERGILSAVERLGTSDVEVNAETAERLLGNVDLRRAQTMLTHSEYFDRVLERRGIRGLVLPPRRIVSTIHGAKGREADHVSLISSWGWLPGKGLSNREQAASESCVAYVASSRHRTSLTLVDLPGSGIPYPFPRAGVDELTP